MATSRTRDPPASGRQQGVKSTIIRLGALCKLDSLQGVADAVDWAEQVSSNQTAVAYACTADDGEDVVSHNKLLEALHSAISTGQKQLALNWPQEASPAAAHTRHDPTHRDAAFTVAYLCRALALCRRLSWYKQEHRSKEVDSAIKAGFLQNFSSLISKLLPALLGTAAQYAASMQKRAHRLVAMCLLELWCYIFDSWPGCKLTDSSLVATIEPAASLACALMRSFSTAIIPTSSSNFSRTPGISKNQLPVITRADEVMRSSCCHTSVCFACGLLCVVQKECCIAQYSSNNPSASSSNAEAALASAEVQRLLLFGLAAAAAVMHRQQAADSTPPLASAANRASHTLQPGNLQQGGRQQHADLGCIQLLVGLGFAEADELIGLLIKQDGIDVYEALKKRGSHHRMFTAVGYLYTRFCHHQEEDGSSSIGTSPQVNAGIPTLLQQLALPVLHTLKDMTLLLPDDVASTLNLLIALHHQPIDSQQPQPSKVTEALHYALLAVVGKAMYAAAVSLLKHNVMPVSHFMVCMHLQPWVDLAQQGTGLVLHAAGDCGKAAMAAAEVDKLLEQLMEQVETPLLADTADDGEASRQVLHRLQQCGAAICAALPVKFCCNNPACVNLAKLSEQQLVAGKGSRCSGCKVPRYCSR